MSSIGPQPPPHLSKRKRTPEDDEKDVSPQPKQVKSQQSTSNEAEIDLEDSDDDYGPSVPTAPTPAPAPEKPTVGPSLPPSNNHEIDLDSGSDSDVGPAPPKPAVGPTAPVQPAAATADSESDNSDDDYGPAPPSAANAPKRPIGPQLPAAEPKRERDSWMIAPPQASSYAERDPTKMRNRKFASKPGPSQGSAVSSIWTETPEEKLKRLQDSVLGREDKTQDAATKPTKTREEEKREREIAANIEAKRGKSLFDEHQAVRDKGGDDVEEEDDPSKRAFDREKDMALGGKIGSSQRKELINKAANFGGRFQKGSYL